ncbi:MAG: serine/threonine-protein kinase [Phycisphaerales bacterium]|jgi:serine/threonine protein kinase|nr:serine/threonine-protein kinase [Phycisphaerales bacterium]
MTSERVKDILSDALERPAHERDAYITEACAGDAPLEARVRELARAWARATGPLAEPGSLIVGLSSDIRAEKPGDRIGAYTLLEVLGEGGFGIVFRARQDEPVRRELAVKVLRPGMDSRAVLARFDAERQALARLAHPAIARIYDAGVAPSGRPYFAMELVEGYPLTDFCDARSLDVRERIELFTRVCHAVQHAHQKGIIHRDLKPSNILVTQDAGEPEPKVIDFGIAKATDEPLTDNSVITLARQLVGTPRYMSPEQASLDPAAVDARSDIYSLGVVLYELLTGSTPLSDERIRDMGVTSLHDALSRGEFHKPSTRLTSFDEPLAQAVARRRGETIERLRETLRNDLDWIVMRAVEPDPARRYPTAFALARDLERYLAGQPVEARPPSRVYLARKFARRHRAGVTAATLTVLALVAGLGVAIYAFDRASRQRDAAQLALEEANSITDFLARAISSIAPDERGVGVKVADILDAAASEMETSYQGRDSARARIHQVLANAYWHLGEYAKGERQYRAAISFRERFAPPDDPSLLRTRSNLASLLYERGDVGPALLMMKDAVELHTSKYGEKNEESLGMLGNYALMLRAAGQPDQSAAIERRVLAARLELNGEDHRRTLGARINLANSLFAIGEVAEAETLYRTALATAERTLPPDTHEAILALEGVSNFLHRTGRQAEAIPLARRIIEARERVFGPNHPQTIMAMYNLGANLLDTGALEEGRDLQVETLRRDRATLPANHVVSIALVTNFLFIADELGWSAIPTDTRDELLALIHEAAELPLTRSSRNDLANALADIPPADLPLARRMAEIACADAEAAGDSFLYGYLDTLAMVMHRQGEHAAAIETQKRAIELTPKNDPGLGELNEHLHTYEAALEDPAGEPPSPPG